MSLNTDRRSATYGCTQRMTRSTLIMLRSSVDGVGAHTLWASATVVARTRPVKASPQHRPQPQRRCFWTLLLPVRAADACVVKMELLLQKMAYILVIFLIVPVPEADSQLTAYSEKIPIGKPAIRRKRLTWNTRTFIWITLSHVFCLLIWIAR